MSSPSQPATATAPRELNAREAAGGCVFCTYEIEARGMGHVRTVPAATQVVATPRGPRDLCDAHAARGTWSTAETIPAPPEAT